MTKQEAELLKLIRMHDKTNPIFGKRILHLLGIKTDVQLRQSVNALRCAGHAVCAGSRGYWVAKGQSEVDDQIKSLQTRQQGLQEAIDGLRKARVEEKPKMKALDLDKDFDGSRDRVSASDQIAKLLE